jgi:hypothetical protein
MHCRLSINRVTVGDTGDIAKLPNFRNLVPQKRVVSQQNRDLLQEEENVDVKRKRKRKYHNLRTSSFAFGSLSLYI